MVFTIIVIMGQKGKKLIGLGAECLASLFSWEYHSKDPPLPTKQVQDGQAEISGDSGPRVGVAVRYHSCSCKCSCENSHSK